MKPITYKIFGGITFISGIPFFHNWITSIDTGADGLWIPFLIGLILCVAGTSYVLFGMDTIKISKSSNRSLGTMIVAFFVAVGGSLLTWLYSVLTDADPMGLILVLGFIYLGAIIALIAFFLLIIAVIKRELIT